MNNQQTNADEASQANHSGGMTILDAAKIIKRGRVTLAPCLTPTDENENADIKAYEQVSGQMFSLDHAWFSDHPDRNFCRSDDGAAYGVA